MLAQNKTLLQNLSIFNRSCYFAYFLHIKACLCGQSGSRSRIGFSVLSLPGIPYLCGLNLHHMEIRNVAIIAHVDHGKTTLVDNMIYQTHLLRENQEMGSLILDQNDLERERGITIFLKTSAFFTKA